MPGLPGVASPPDRRRPGAGGRLSLLCAKESPRTVTNDTSTASGRPSGGGPRGQNVPAAALLGHALFRAAPDDLPALRRRPGPEGGAKVAPSVLRYSDEQTVAGVAAVFSALDAMGADPDRFEGWGVVVASRFLGRSTLAKALQSFSAEGVWGVSPHLIPHFALHSPAGTISLALGLHGPNLGVGGGRNAPAEGFLTAVSWLAGGSVPGVWLVLTGWDPELRPDRREPGPSRCSALALALVEADPEDPRPSFAILPADSRLYEPPGDWLDLARRLDGDGDGEGDGDAGRRTVASDASGRLRVEWRPAREAVSS